MRELNLGEIHELIKSHGRALAQFDMHDKREQLADMDGRVFRLNELVAEYHRLLLREEEKKNG